jgi:hypothetical protein
MSESQSQSVVEQTWMPSRAVEGTESVRVSWIVHSDAMVDGGRVASHRGPCGRNATHLILWHWCTGEVDMKAYGASETAEFYPRWIPSMSPDLTVGMDSVSGALWVTLGDGGKLRWPKCCGLAGRVQDGLWVPA